MYPTLFYSVYFTPDGGSQRPNVPGPNVATMCSVSRVQRHELGFGRTLSNKSGVLAYACDMGSQIIAKIAKMRGKAVKRASQPKRKRIVRIRTPTNANARSKVKDTPSPSELEDADGYISYGDLPGELCSRCGTPIDGLARERR